MFAEKERPSKKSSRHVFPTPAAPITATNVYSTTHSRFHTESFIVQQTNRNKIKPACTRFSYVQAVRTYSTQSDSGKRSKCVHSACIGSTPVHSCTRAPCVRAARSGCTRSRSGSLSLNGPAAGSGSTYCTARSGGSGEDALYASVWIIRPTLHVSPGEEVAQGNYERNVPACDRSGK